MVRCLLPLLAALLGGLLGGFVQGRPPSRPRHRDQEQTNAHNWEEPSEEEWYEPHPEPVADPYHQWNAQGRGTEPGTTWSSWSSGQDLGMGQWSPSWTWSSWTSWTPSSTTSYWDEARDRGREWHDWALHYRNNHGNWDRGATPRHDTPAPGRPSTTGDRRQGPEAAGRDANSDDRFLYVPGWGRGAPLLPPDRRAPGFFRDGRWVDRPRNDWEERWQRGGGGEVRTQRREARQAQWLDGSFRPAAFWRARSLHRDGLVVDEEARERFRLLLRQADGDRTVPVPPADREPPASSPPGDHDAPAAPLQNDRSMRHQVLTHTGGDTYASPWWTAEEWKVWGARKRRGADEAIGAVDWSGPGLPDIEDFLNVVLGRASSPSCARFSRTSSSPVSTTSTTTSSSSTSSGGMDQRFDEVAMMQTGRGQSAASGEDRDDGSSNGELVDAAPAAGPVNIQQP
eukprot:s713_g5.t1